MDLSFLPQLPFALSAPIMFGALLAAGLLAGEAANRYASLPRITGYALAGVALGPQMSGVLSSEMLHALSVLIDLSVGLIVFELGFRFDWRWLKRNRWLLVTAVAESLFGFGAIFGTLLYFGFPAGAGGKCGGDRHGHLAGDSHAGRARAARGGPGHRKDAPVHGGQQRLRLRGAHPAAAVAAPRAEGGMARGGAAPALTSSAARSSRARPRAC